MRALPNRAVEITTLINGRIIEERSPEVNVMSSAQIYKRHQLV